MRYSRLGISLIPAGALFIDTVISPTLYGLVTGTVFTLTVESVLTVYTWQTETWRDAVVGRDYQHLKCAMLKRSCASKAEVLIKKQCKVQAPRRRHVVKSPTPPAGHAPPPILRERSMSNLPPPSELVTLRGIVKYSPFILEQGMQTLQSYTERNTSFVVQKSVVIQVYGACISSGIGILEACRVTGISMGFSEQVVRRSMLISLAS